MTKNELITNIAAKVEIPKSACCSVIDAFAEEIKNCLIKGDKIILTNFMSFEVSEWPEREARNPKTGQVTTFPPVKSVKCRVSKSIKDAINKR